MNKQAHIMNGLAKASEISPLTIGVLQRKCACGQHTIAGGECETCNQKRLQRHAIDSSEFTEAPPIVQEVLSSPGQPLDAATRALKKPLVKTGKTWNQNGGDAIVKQISVIQDRYWKWFEEMATAADSQWDTQEKAALSKIAAEVKAKEHKPGSSVPDVPGE